MDTGLLDQGFAKLTNTPMGSSVALQAVKDWLLASEPVQRHRINPYLIAAASGQRPEDIVAVALRGVASGLFDLHWLVHCPHCNMVTTEYENFFELTQTSNCKMCGVNFEADFLARVEVSFSLNRAIEDIDMGGFCLPPPVLESKVNISVLPGQSGTGADVIEEPKLYRFFCPITLAKGLLQVEGARTDKVQEFKVRQLPTLNYDQITLKARPGPVRFELVNDCDKVSGIFIIQDELPGELSLEELPPRLTGLSVIHFPEYRQLFGNHVLSDQERIQVSSVTLLFTDIAESTALYETLGNAQAYNVVRQHFTMLSRSVEAHGGFVIKTIGDAVMASFVHSDDAVKCVLDALREFQGLSVGGDGPQTIRVKFGIHRGPVLIVNLNGRVDYFGSTVNTAARIQHCAGGNEVTFSMEVLESSPAANTLLEVCGDAVLKEHVRLKGIKADRTIFRLTLADGPPLRERLGF